ncbi:MAG: hypothetical protein ACR2RF_17815 [Geminicoccaceae bacterium]
MENSEKAFLLREHEAVRTELDEAVRETRVLERYALLVTGAIWSWAMSIDNEFYSWLAWLPLLLILFLAFRAFVLTMHIDDLARYLMKIEKKFELSGGLGFETYFQDRGKVKRFSAYAFWCLLLITSIIIPIAFDFPVGSA